MSQGKAPAIEVQKKTEPARQLKQEAARQPEQGTVQQVAPQAAYQRTQVRRNGLRPADVLALQRTIGNHQVQWIMAWRLSNANDWVQRISTTSNVVQREASSKQVVDLAERQKKALEKEQASLPEEVESRLPKRFTSAELSKIEKLEFLDPVEFIKAEETKHEPMGSVFHKLTNLFNKILKEQTLPKFTNVTTIKGKKEASDAVVFEASEPKSLQRLRFLTTGLICYQPKPKSTKFYDAGIEGLLAPQRANIEKEKKRIEEIVLREKQSTAEKEVEGVKVVPNSKEPKPERTIWEHTNPEQYSQGAGAGVAKQLWGFWEEFRPHEWMAPLLPQYTDPLGLIQQLEDDSEILKKKKSAEEICNDWPTRSEQLNELKDLLKQIDSLIKECKSLQDIITTITNTKKNAKGNEQIGTSENSFADKAAQLIKKSELQTEILGKIREHTTQKWYSFSKDYKVLRIENPQGKPISIDSEIKQLGLELSNAKIFLSNLDTVKDFNQPEKQKQKLADLSAAQLCNVISYYLYTSAIGVETKNFAEYYKTEVSAGRITRHEGELGFFYGTGSGEWRKKAGLFLIDEKTENKKKIPLGDKSRTKELDAFLQSNVNLALVKTYRGSPHFYLIVRDSQGLWHNLDHTRRDFHWRGGLTDFNQVFSIAVDYSSLERSINSQVEAWLQDSSDPALIVKNLSSISDNNFMNLLITNLWQKWLKTKLFSDSNYAINLLGNPQLTAFSKNLLLKNIAHDLLIDKANLEQFSILVKNIDDQSIKTLQTEKVKLREIRAFVYDRNHPELSEELGEKLVRLIGAAPPQPHTQKVKL